MRRLLRGFGLGLAVLGGMLAIAVVVVSQGVGRGPRVEGVLEFAGLQAPVRVLRDANGIPSVFAANLPDLIRAQGFVTAQDRLFQLEGYRALATGRLAESIGEAGLASDRQIRLLGLRRNAERHARLLTPEARQFLLWYAAGMNAYIVGHAGDHPVELRLAGFTPRPWTLEDMVTVLHFVNWSQAANFRAELTMQRLADRLGPAVVAAELLPVNVNADNETAVDAGGGLADAGSRAKPVPAAVFGLARQRWLLAADGIPPGGIPVGAPLAVGSNNWVVAPARSASGAAMVVNDPHLDARMLPGIWHPIGLHAPGLDAVGAALPAVPGIVLGRNAHVAFGVTNAYGDSQDLYIEQQVPGHPDRYVDGAVERAFGLIDETIRVKDKRAAGGFREVPFRIRTTVRGPVVSEGPEFAVGGGRFLSLRMASAELPAGGLGFDRLLVARNADEVDAAVQQMPFVYFNFVFADRQGNIGYRASGRVPIRRGAPGSYPRLPSTTDDWVGYIPPDRVPGSRSPTRGWLATANHDTRPMGYPYEYSSYFAPSYRYRRIGEMLSTERPLTADDQAKFMLDATNVQARRWLPVMLRVVAGMPDQSDLHALLAHWDGRDTADQAAPLVYHRLYEELARQTYADEMGDELARQYLGQWYLWQERFDRLAGEPDAHWFDDTATPAREHRDDLVRRAVTVARAALVEQYGPDLAKWRWGVAHRVRFHSPLRKSGAGSEWLGRAPVAMDGSTDTVLRAMTRFGEGFDVGFFASARFVADLADDDKVLAVISGGVVDRQFHPHQQDQLDPWSEGKLLPWWLAPAQAEAHAVQRQTLVPAGATAPSP